MVVILCIFLLRLQGLPRPLLRFCAKVKRRARAHRVTRQLLLQHLFASGSQQRPGTAALVPHRRRSSVAWWRRRRGNGCRKAGASTSCCSLTPLPGLSSPLKICVTSNPITTYQRTSPNGVTRTITRPSAHPEKPQPGRLAVSPRSNGAHARSPALRAAIPHLRRRYSEIHQAARTRSSARSPARLRRRTSCQTVKANTSECPAPTAALPASSAHPWCGRHPAPAQDTFCNSAAASARLFCLISTSARPK